MGGVLVVGAGAGQVTASVALLRSRGHAVTEAAEGVEALLLAAATSPAVVVLALPVGAPGPVSAVAVLAALLADDPARPVLVLAAPEEVPAGVRRLAPGVLEWMPTPFGAERLVARVEHRLRGPLRDATPPEDHLPVGSLHLDLRGRRIVVPSRGGSLDLTRREFDLLVHLARETGRVCPRAELLSAIWGHGPDDGSNVLDATVARLRAKLAKASAREPSAPTVETVRGLGYRLREV